MDIGKSESASVMMYMLGMVRRRLGFLLTAISTIRLPKINEQDEQWFHNHDPGTPRVEVFGKSLHTGYNTYTMKEVKSSPGTPLFGRSVPGYSALRFQDGGRRSLRVPWQSENLRISMTSYKRMTSDFPRWRLHPLAIWMDLFVDLHINFRRVRSFFGGGGCTLSLSEPRVSSP